jgi:hypothetical protein
VCVCVCVCACVIVRNQNGGSQGGCQVNAFRARHGMQFTGPCFIDSSSKLKRGTSWRRSDCTEGLIGLTVQRWSVSRGRWIVIDNPEAEDGQYHLSNLGVSRDVEDVEEGCSTWDKFLQYCESKYEVMAAIDEPDATAQAYSSTTMMDAWGTFAERGPKYCYTARRSSMPPSPLPPSPPPSLCLPPPSGRSRQRLGCVLQSPLSLPRP